MMFWPTLELGTSRVSNYPLSSLEVQPCLVLAAVTSQPTKQASAHVDTLAALSPCLEAAKMMLCSYLRQLTRTRLTLAVHLSRKPSAKPSIHHSLARSHL